MNIAVFFVFLITLGGSFAFADQVTTEIPLDAKIHYVDEQIMIMADITNNQDIPQNFAYLTQVRNDQDVVISLSWLTGSLSPKQSFSPAQSWTPNEPGVYHIQVFVWESIDNPEALSPPLAMTVYVEQRIT